MTAKKTKANRANALKSSGPKTANGKAVVAGNAMRHGILSARLFLAGENQADFAELVADLQAALRPQGALEAVLVDKIGVAIWRQRRLAAAEAASIELGRRFEHGDNRHAVERAAGIGYGDFSVADAVPLTNDDKIQIKWCRGVLAEFAALDEAVLATNDRKRLAKDAPLMFGQLENEEAEDGEPAQQMQEWAEDLHSWCEQELKKLERRPVVQAVAELVQAELSAPVANELLSRYQTALDNELYKAIRNLREQQEWRVKNSAVIEAEAA